MRTVRFYGTILSYLIKKKKFIDDLYKRYEAGEEVRNEMDALGKEVSRNLVKISGSTVTVKGLLNLDVNENYLFVGNHQGNMDILTLMAVVPHNIGFMAKKELIKLPVIGRGMQLKGCVFLDRKDNRSAVKSFNEGIDLLNKGASLVIFPEGTRSKSNTINEFRPGALRLAIKSGVKVIPVTMKNTYKIMEEKNGRIQPADVVVEFSEAIDSTRYKTAKELSEAVETIIRQNS